MRTRIEMAGLNAVIALLSFAPLAAVQAQDDASLPDAATILDRYVEVTGGVDAYESRGAMIVHGRMEIAAQGLSGSLTIYQDAGNSYTVVEIPGIGQIESGVTDGVAWENSVLGGARIKSGIERAQAIRDAAADATARWREMYPQVETVGIETIDGEEAYEVMMTAEAGDTQSMFFGVESGLARRTDLVVASPLGDLPMQMSLSDYRDFGGVLTPTTLTQSVAGQTVRMTLESAETNAAIPAGRFDLPDAVAAIAE